MNLTDSTGISLPETLGELFPGSGGNASESGLKTQLVFDFVRGCFKAITITDGMTPDQKYAGHVGTAEPNSLSLSDLGYFAIRNLKGFADKGAFFLCRLLPGTNLYDENGQKPDLTDFLIRETQNFFEADLPIGQIPCRVCFCRVPEEAANLRRQKANKNAARKGRTPSKASLMLMGRTIVDNKCSEIHAFSQPHCTDLFCPPANRTDFQALEKSHENSSYVRISKRSYSG